MSNIQLIKNCLHSILIVIEANERPDDIIFLYTTVENYFTDAPTNLNKTLSLSWSNNEK